MSAISKAQRAIENGKTYKVAAISGNTNSFGLFGIVLVAWDGEAWNVGVNYIIRAKLADGANVALPRDEGGHIMPTPEFCFEIPSRLQDAPPAVVKELWGEKGDKPDPRTVERSWPAPKDRR